MEEEPLWRLGAAGRLDSTWHDRQRVLPAEKLLGDLASKSLPLGRTGVEQRHGQWGTRELGGAWQ